MQISIEIRTQIGDEVEVFDAVTVTSGENPFTVAVGILTGIEGDARQHLQRQEIIRSRELRN